jgi:hypothetical protein
MAKTQRVKTQRAKTQRDFRSRQPLMRRRLQTCGLAHPGHCDCGGENGGGRRICAGKPGICHRSRYMDNSCNPRRPTRFPPEQWVTERMPRSAPRPELRCVASCTFRLSASSCPPRQRRFGVPSRPSLDHSRWSRGSDPQLLPPNNGPPTRPHMWGATPCIEARACQKVRPTQRLCGRRRNASMRRFVPGQALFLDNSSPPLPAVRQQSCSAKRRPGGSRPMSPSCRSC